MIALICLFGFSSILAEEIDSAAVEGTANLTYPLDSTAAIKPVRIKKRFGDYLLSFPQYIIHVPDKAIEYAFKHVLFRIYDNPVTAHALRSLKIERVWGFGPVVGVGANAGLIGGVSFKSRDAFTKGERIRASFTYSTTEYQRYELSYNLPHWTGYKYDINFLAQYSFMTRENFYGLGQESVDTNEVAYSIEQTLFEASYDYFVSPHISIGLGGGYRIVNLYDGEDPALEGNLDTILADPDFGLSSGSFDGVGLLSFTGVIRTDWTDHPGQPSRGCSHSLSVSYNAGRDRYSGVATASGNQFKDLKYVSVAGEVWHYFEIYRKRIIALRATVRHLELDEGSPEVPFYMRSRLGGEGSLRGYRTDRFVDNDMILLTAEYRYPIWDVVDAYVFLDQGRVFGDITEEFKWRGWDYSTGLGLRIWNNEGLLAKAEMAFSEEGFRAYLTIGKAMGL